jgi:phospholipid/cholesterol/gamma-HCH transport system substrate-binding protein
MAKQAVNNIKLGIFVLAGLVFLVILLYMIGKNQNLFGPTYELRARFENVQGLMTGNNVRFSGIEAGTVKTITILNDTVIEVTMLIEDKMKPVIKKNAIAYIGTEGLVGNKVVNIIPSGKPGDLAQEGDLLPTREAIDTDDIIQTLSKTNDDIAEVAADLKLTIDHINNSNALWRLLSDETLPEHIRNSIINIRTATQKANSMTRDLHDIVLDIKKGEGSVGALLTDTSYSHDLKTALVKLNDIEKDADSLMASFGDVVAGISFDINNGKGAANAVLKDTAIVAKLNESLNNIQEGTDKFNQNMEALKHNFLFRGYFRKQEKQKQKEAVQTNKD